jgi:hypothetical protein
MNSKLKCRHFQTFKEISIFIKSSALDYIAERGLIKAKASRFLFNLAIGLRVEE